MLTFVQRAALVELGSKQTFAGLVNVLIDWSNIADVLCVKM
jgi:hypothetical protein